MLVDIVSVSKNGSSPIFYALRSLAMGEEAEMWAYLAIACHMSPSSFPDVSVYSEYLSFSCCLFNPDSFDNFRALCEEARAHNRLTHALTGNTQPRSQAEIDALPSLIEIFKTAKPQRTGDLLTIKYLSKWLLNRVPWLENNPTAQPTAQQSLVVSIQTKPSDNDQSYRSTMASRFSGLFALQFVQGGITVTRPFPPPSRQITTVPPSALVQSEPLSTISVGNSSDMMEVRLRDLAMVRPQTQAINRFFENDMLSISKKIKSRSYSNDAVSLKLMMALECILFASGDPARYPYSLYVSTSTPDYALYPNVIGATLDPDTNDAPMGYPRVDALDENIYLVEPEDQGALYFNVTLATVPDSALDNTLFVAPEFFSSVPAATASRRLALLISVICEWPIVAPMADISTVDVSGVLPAAYSLVAGTTQVAGPRSLFLVLPSNVASINVTANNASSLPMILPQWGPVTKGSVVAGEPASVRWLDGNTGQAAGGFWPLCSFVRSWADSWTEQDWDFVASYCESSFGVTQMDLDAASFLLAYTSRLSAPALTTGTPNAAANVIGLADIEGRRPLYPDLSGGDSKIDGTTGQIIPFLRFTSTTATIRQSTPWVMSMMTLGFSRPADEKPISPSLYGVLPSYFVMYPAVLSTQADMLSLAFSLYLNLRSYRPDVLSGVVINQAKPYRNINTIFYANALPFSVPSMSEKFGILIELLFGRSIPSCTSSHLTFFSASLRMTPKLVAAYDITAATIREYLPVLVQEGYIFTFPFVRFYREFAPFFPDVGGSQQLFFPTGKGRSDIQVVNNANVRSPLYSSKLLGTYALLSNGRKIRSTLDIYASRLLLLSNADDSRLVDNLGNTVPDTLDRYPVLPHIISDGNFAGAAAGAFVLATYGSHDSQPLMIPPYLRQDTGPVCVLAETSDPNANDQKRRLQGYDDQVMTYFIYNLIEPDLLGDVDEADMNEEFDDQNVERDALVSSFPSADPLMAPSSDPLVPPPPDGSGVAGVASPTEDPLKV
jgi:hypothetical protein